MNNVLIDTFMSAQQLSKALGISRSGLFQLAQRGELPKGVKIGKSRRWAVSEINAWLRDKQKGATHE